MSLRGGHENNDDVMGRSNIFWPNLYWAACNYWWGRGVFPARTIPCSAYYHYIQVHGVRYEYSVELGILSGTGVPPTIVFTAGTWLTYRLRVSETMLLKPTNSVGTVGYHKFRASACHHPNWLTSVIIHNANWTTIQVGFTHKDKVYTSITPDGQRNLVIH